METNEVSKSNKIKIIVITALIFLVSIAGISYAYFTIQITGNDTASSMRLRTANMSLVYNDVQIVSGEYAQPGWTDTKTLTVTNNGNVDVTYNLVWRDLVNEIIYGELVISATCSSSSGSCNNISETVIPTNTTEAHNVGVTNGITIAPGVTHTYTLTALFKETGSNQNYNQNKYFNGTLNIEEFGLKRNGTEPTTGLSMVKVGTEEFYDITSAIDYSTLINANGNIYNYGTNKTVLLAKYNLLVGDVYIKQAGSFRRMNIMNANNTVGYGLQNEIAKGATDLESIRIGVVGYSGKGYWDNANCAFTGPGSNDYTCTGTSGLKPEYANISNLSGATGNYTTIYPDAYRSSMSSIAPSLMETSDFNGLYRTQDNGYTIAYYVEEYVQTLKSISSINNIEGRLLTYEEANVLPSIIRGGTSYWLGSVRNSSRVLVFDVINNTFMMLAVWVATQQGVRPVIIVNTSDIQSS